MGWKPADVYDCTVAEFWAAFEGWRQAQGIEDAPEPMTRQELWRIAAEHGLKRRNG